MGRGQPMLFDFEAMLDSPIEKGSTWAVPSRDSSEVIVSITCYPYLPRDCGRGKGRSLKEEVLGLVTPDTAEREDIVFKCCSKRLGGFIKLFR